MQKIIAILILLSASLAQAWGGRGHHAICDAATQLVENKDLKTFLVRRAHMMGHLCNIPDIHWKDLGPSAEVGNATHYFEPDLVGVSAKDIPLDYKEAVKMLSTHNHVELKSPVKSVSGEIGSAWWRADQFFRLALEQGVKAKALPSPHEKAEKQKYDLPFNAAIFAMITDMGLMGHFVGDISQPLHNTSDYDGYNVNHGGLHSYYEDGVVAAIDGNIVGKIVTEASKKKKSYAFLKDPSPVAQMKAMAILALGELKEVLKHDKMLQPSILVHGSSLTKKIPAERPLPSQALKNYEPLIIGQMARSAALLAKMWDNIYEKAGKPDIQAYESYRYPFQPDFVAPDYIP
jgi:hypothetical protein